ncbi:MAG: hypothetical protein RSC43_08355 [Clostridia bacterium]
MDNNVKSPDMKPNESIEQIENPKTAEEVYRGSLAAILQNNLGYYVVCEFLVGTNNIVIKDGVLYAVGINFVTLYQEDEERYVICDLYSLKFVNFYASRTRPRNLRPIRHTV